MKHLIIISLLLSLTDSHCMQRPDPIDQTFGLLIGAIGLTGALYLTAKVLYLTHEEKNKDPMLTLETKYKQELESEESKKKLKQAYRLERQDELNLLEKHLASTSNNNALQMYVKLEKEKLKGT